jgi:hypothetical protein
MAYDEGLADRVRALLQDRPGITEKRMFGGIAFLIDDKMAVTASSKGGLMVRVDPTDTPGLVEQSGIERMEMRGRKMDGWLRVDASVIAVDEALRAWVDRGASYAASLAE